VTGLPVNNGCDLSGITGFDKDVVVVQVVVPKVWTADDVVLREKSGKDMLILIQGSDLFLWVWLV